MVFPEVGGVKVKTLPLQEEVFKVAFICGFGFILIIYVEGAPIHFVPHATVPVALYMISIGALVVFSKVCAVIVFVPEFTKGPVIPVGFVAVQLNVTLFVALLNITSSVVSPEHFV